MKIKKLLKTLLIILLCFVLSVIVQNISMLWHIVSIWSVEYILHALTYIVLSYFSVKWFIEIVLKSNMKDYRIIPVKFFKFCFLIGLILILVIDLIYLLFIPGKLIIPHYSTSVGFMEMFFSAFLITGIAAPIFEEMVFRGILMRYFEKQYGILFGIIIPSILFSLVHLFNGELKGENLLLLLIGGSIAGIMYAVTAWTFNSIWASAILHMLWNINGLLNITTQDDHWGVYQYILETKNVLITGGDYGMDTSLLSICSYIAVIIVMIVTKRHFNFLLK
ncbi:CPBP family intramembrane glutamic endopeptidase [Staphylococcus epidermidis]